MSAKVGNWVMGGKPNSSSSKSSRGSKASRGSSEAGSEASPGTWDGSMEKAQLEIHLLAMPEPQKLVTYPKSSQLLGIICDENIRVAILGELGMHWAGQVGSSIGGTCVLQSRRKMIVASFLMVLVRMVVALYTFLTYPIYALVYRPCCKPGRRVSAGQAQARIVSRAADEVTYRAIPYATPIRDEILAHPDHINTLEKLFRFTVKKYGSRPALGSRTQIKEVEEKGENGKILQKLILGDYHWHKYTDVDARADQFGRGIRELGVAPRSRVCIFADTRVEWMTAALGCFKNSIGLVTIYTNLGDEGIVHGITQTQVETAITSVELLPKLLSVLPDMPQLKNIVYFENPHKTVPKAPEHVSLYAYSEVVSLGQKSSVAPAWPESSDIAIVMYTSGSTGVPKGVVLTHGNLVSGALSILPLAERVLGEYGSVTEEDAYIAFLPLAHVLEMLAEMVMLVLGVKLGYSSPNTLTDKGSMIKAGAKGDASVLRPTVMCAVPLILDRIYKGIKLNISQRSEFFQRLIGYCIEYRQYWVHHGYDTPIMNRIVFAKMQSIIGGRLKVLLSGGAPLSEDAHAFIQTCLGCALHQGYGLTETCSTACITAPGDMRTGIVGPPLIGVDLKIIDSPDLGYTVRDANGPRGEIVIGGHHVAREYYNMPDKSGEDFFQEDGKQFFRTGDIGLVLPDGSLKIIDRKKDLVKMQGGEYVSLGKVEASLKTHALIENICAYGDSHTNSMVALVVPDEAKLIEIGEEMGKSNKSREELCRDPQILKKVTDSIIQHGQRAKLQKFEIPRQFHLISEPWTPESGLVTAAFKLKRKPIQQKYEQEIKDMYRQLENPGSSSIPMSYKGKNKVKPK
eukprot:maker-scaffold81_size397536-snap-gene-2.20 protein:Tk08538 transcript:maker-scaffold81_size397536-snap-gene-2.20-mRNA-1 annotation:"long-chain-fatty-acid-- ligase 3"